MVCSLYSTYVGIQTQNMVIVFQVLHSISSLKIIKFCQSLNLLFLKRGLQKHLGWLIIIICTTFFCNLQISLVLEAFPHKMIPYLKMDSKWSFSNLTGTHVRLTNNKTGLVFTSVVFLFCKPIKQFLILNFILLKKTCNQFSDTLRTKVFVLR